MLEDPDLKNKIANSKAEKIKILIVDDDAEIRETMSTILTDEGYISKAVETGKEALDCCRKELFAIGLIDINLPDMSGTVVLQSLKKICPAMIKIMITGYPSLDNAVQSLNSGAEGYIIKPFKPSKLLELIQEQLQKHKVETWENLLKGTGLSSYEAKIYLALALNGTSEARKISLLSGVPRTKAYVALKKLHQRGIVTTVPGGKQKFVISAPSDSFKVFMQNWKRELSKQEKNLADFENVIETLEQIHVSNQSLLSANMHKEDVWVMNGKGVIDQRIGELLAVAKSNVYLATNEESLSRLYRNFHKTLDQLSGRGVEIQISVPFGSGKSGFLNELKYVYKLKDSPVLAPIIFVAIDNSEFLLANYEEDADPENEICIFAQSENMLNLYKSFLCPQKKKANPKKT
jgi:sugar-specific transcriptional regulator TrmB/CheY-like chemotaxis protein